MTVLEAVQLSKTPTLMHKGSISAAEKMILPNETVLWALTTNVTVNAGKVSKPTPMDLDGKKAGVVVVTTQRILFVNSVLGVGSSKEIRLSEIHSIDENITALAANLRIVGITAKLLVDGNSKTIGELRTAINDAISNLQSAAPANPAGTSDIEQLQALKQLYDSGVLTAEEFAAKKAQILNI